VIVEGVVTTIGADGRVNVAPMGPLTDPELRTFTFRPFKSARTYLNLVDNPEGVFHITDDVDLIARACVGDVQPPMRDADRVHGKILADACRFYEFRVVDLDDREERTRIEVEVVSKGRQRDFFGFNRAKHAVIEAAIAASRIGILPAREIREEFSRLAVLVEKTASAAEKGAFEFLLDYTRERIGELENDDLVEDGTVEDGTVEDGTVKDGIVQVETGSRLHFGLLSPFPLPGRRHGGLGMTVDRPGVELTLARASKQRVEGEQRERATRVLQSVLNAVGRPNEGVHLNVKRAPREHIGLGTGTQMSLAIARGVAEVLGLESDSEDLALWTGRGLRSGVGVRGFEFGGFLVDGGHAEGATSCVAPLLTRLEVPESWRVLLVTPPGARGISGTAERAAFRQLGGNSRGGSSDDAAREMQASAICRDVLLGVLPALAERDFDTFVSALWSVQVQVGEVFSSVQGGRFASSETTAVVESLRRLGAVGTGQSSWGPTVFAFARCAEDGQRWLESLQREFGLSKDDGFLTKPRNRGARVQRLARASMVSVTSASG
jgi:beta-RFAP synthase